MKLIINSNFSDTMLFKVERAKPFLQAKLKAAYKIPYFQIRDYHLKYRT
jgi:hypothetical protein